MILKKEDNTLPFERKSKYVGRINGVESREKIFPLYEQQRSKIMVMHKSMSASTHSIKGELVIFSCQRKSITVITLNDMGGKKSP